MKKKENRFNIDFFEFSFLVEACIPPRPIARAVFWDDVIDKYYHVLTQNERNNLFDWIGRSWVFQDGLEKGVEGCLLFQARYNPLNQFNVTTLFEGKEKTTECFKFMNKYCKSKTVSINEKYITEVKPIEKLNEEI